MQILKYASLTLMGSALLFSSHVFSSETYPEVVQQIVDRGLSVVSTFESIPGFQGYILEAQGKPLTVYVTETGQHAFVGTLIDKTGNDLSAPKLEEQFYQKKYLEAWDKLETSNWILDGSPTADTIIYAFDDPNCPYCHKFRKAAQPWIESGQVQVRHIMVGVLAPSSLPKAATIMGSPDNYAAYKENVANFKNGGIEPDVELQKIGESKVMANNQLMERLDVHATPGIYFRNSTGQVQMRLGLPNEQELIHMMGN